MYEGNVRTPPKRVLQRERERERERERQRETDRERQRERETERQRKKNAILTDRLNTDLTRKV